MHPRRSSSRLIPLVAVFLLLQACSRPPQHHITRAFYYWKTAYGPGVYEQQRLRSLQCRKLYVRLFDVDHDPAGPVPVGTLRWKQRPDTALEYVPCIFITQQALDGLKPAGIPLLAERMAHLAEGLCVQGGISPKELQIDCDWTARNKELYFLLLKALKQQPYCKDKLLSCTIRLYQVKYVRRNGVPPVDRGLLMCYNMGDMRKPGDHNSILDPAEAKAYLSGIGSYPLPLDVALPLFSQCLLFRKAQLQGILRDVSPEDIGASGLFVRDGENNYRVLADSNWKGFALQRDDRIRVEQVPPDAIKKTAAYLLDRLKTDSLSLAFFDCDSLTLSKYPDHDLETIYHAGL